MPPNNLITQHLTTLLQTLGVSFDTIKESELAGSKVFTVVTKESALLIGHNGETLTAINHLIKRMCEGEEVPAHFSIDVNGYQAQKIKSLEEQARVVAERARTFRYDIDMSPMSSYERMIVHSALKSMPDIDSSSAGEGALRHIVVRYKDPTAPANPKATSAESDGL